MITNLVKTLPYAKLLNNIASVKPKLIKINHTKIAMAFSSTEPLSPQMTSQQPYTQRAFTPSQMSQQLISQLSTLHSPQQILHQLTLFHLKLLPFDYDYFTESLRRLIPHQSKMNLDDILMLFDLAIQYKIDSLILQKQFMNEIYCRVYSGMRKELAGYDKQIETQVKNTYQKLEKMSSDHFGIVSEQYKQFLEDKEQQNVSEPESSQLVGQSTAKDEQKDFDNDKIQKAPSFNPLGQMILQEEVSRPVHNSKNRKTKSKTISPQTLNRITRVFVEYSSKNIQFNRLLLELHTVRMDESMDGSKEKKQQEKKVQPDTQSLLLFTRLTVNLLQLYMSEYQSGLSKSKNKQHKYTHRSVKTIYKLQHFYYYELAKLIEEKLLLSQATNQQLLQFLTTISSFPIKRRSFRKTVGMVVIQEFKKRQIQFDAMMDFFQLSKYDNKLLQLFENQINGRSLIPQANIPSQQNPNTAEQSSNKPLTPDLILQSDQHPQQTDNSVFKMPLSLFKKVTKKKSKPKNKKFLQNEVEIDLTQPEEQINHSEKSSQINNQQTIQKQLNQQNAQ